MTRTSSEVIANENAEVLVTTILISEGNIYPVPDKTLLRSFIEMVLKEGSA